MSESVKPHRPVGARWLAKLQRPGDCLKCGTTVPAGAQALWLMNRGVCCEPCGAAYEAEGNPVKGQRKVSPTKVEDSNSSR